MESAHASLLDFVRQRTRPGDIRGVINAIDEYAWTYQWLMNIGDRKGEILDHAIVSRRPRTILELGNRTAQVSLATKIHTLSFPFKVHTSATVRCESLRERPATR